MVFSSGHSLKKSGLRQTRYGSFYQIALSYPGDYYDSTEIEMMAKKIKDHFYRGFIFSEGNDKIIIERHPDNSPPFKNNKRLDMTIRIRYYCF